VVMGKRQMFDADIKIDVTSDVDRIIVRATNSMLHYMLVSVDPNIGGYKILKEYHTGLSVEFNVRGI